MRWRTGLPVRANLKLGELQPALVLHSCRRGLSLWSSQREPERLKPPLRAAGQMPVIRVPQGGAGVLVRLSS